MSKKEILLFFKDLQNINLKKICLKLKIDYGNTLSGRTSLENLEKVKKEIINEFIDLSNKWEIDFICQIKK